MTIEKRKFVPRPYQIAMIEHILRNERCALWVPMGMGKTSATLAAVSSLNAILGEEPTLVLAPLRVAEETWPAEVQKWEDFSHLSAKAVTGRIPAAKRVKELRELPDILATNFENIEWLIEHFGENWPFTRVIVDESTKLKGYRIKKGTKRSKALARIAHTKVQRLVELTGTPSANGLIDLWGQMWFLDRGMRLGYSYTAFSQRWFITGYDGFSQKPVPTAQQEISERLKDICLSIRAEDHFPLDEPVVAVIDVTLPARVREDYKRLEDEMFTMLASGETVTAVNAAVVSQKCLQLASGAVYVDAEHRVWNEVHAEKIEALREIIEENAGANILVAYNFRADLERLKKHFPKGVALSEHSDSVRRWNAGEIPLMFLHPASAGHGLNLQEGGHHLVFFSADWNLEAHLQVIERIGPTRQKQSGFNRSVFLYYICAKHTVDELVITRLREKKEVQDILLEEMRKRKLTTN